MSHDLKLEHLFDARVRGEFAGGWASILDGLGRAVAARVTDRW